MCTSFVSGANMLGDLFVVNNSACAIAVTDAMDDDTQLL